MSKISIVASQKEMKFAEKLSILFEKLDYETYSNLSFPSNNKRFRTKQQFVSNTNFSNIILLSISLLQENKDFVSLFADALREDQQNIQLVSLDNDWKLISGEDYNVLRNVSYISFEPSSDTNLNTLVSRLLSSAKENAENSLSHLTTDLFDDYLSGSYDVYSCVTKISIGKLNIGFSVFDCEHRNSGEIERYLVLESNSNLAANSQYLKEKKPSVLKCDSLFVVRSNPNRELSVLQKNNMFDLFGGTPLRFETMVKQRNLRKSEANRKFGVDEFVIPQNWIASGPVNKKLSTQELEGYLLSNFEGGLAILTGDGGGGKTHFVRHLHDEVLNNSDRDVFFLSADSVMEIKDNIYIRSLYEMYCACMFVEEQEPLDRKMFSIKFLVENPLIIIDGLEEIVTVLGERIDIVSFIKDCVTKYGVDANGVVVITTRDKSHSEQFDYAICRFDLELFSYDDAQAFFDKKFPTDPKRLKLASTIYSNIVGQETRVPTIFCSLISDEIGAAKEEEFSTYYQKNDKFKSSDGLQNLLSTILDRETAKTEVHFSLQNSLEALGEIAQLCTTGPVAIQTAIDIFSTKIENLMSKEQSKITNAIKNFVFLQYNHETESITFKYEFLRTVLLAKHVLHSLEELEIDTLLSLSGVAVLAIQLQPGSDVVDSILRDNVSQNNAQVLLSIEEVIIDLQSKVIPKVSVKKTRLIISNLIFLRFSLDPKSIDPCYCTKVLCSLFGNSELSISSVPMYYYARDSGASFRFDFTGFLVDGCWFDGVNIDKMFIANEKTKFRKCSFEQCLSNHPSKNDSIWKAIFQENQEDQEFGTVLSKFTAVLEKSDDVKKSEILRLLRSFAKGHNLSRYLHEDVIHGKINNAAVDVDKIIGVLEKLKILSHPPGKKKEFWYIDEGERETVRRFIFDSSSFGKIDEAVKNL